MDLTVQSPMKNALSSVVVSVGSSRSVEYFINTGVAIDIIFVAGCLNRSVCHDSICCYDFGCWHGFDFCQVFVCCELAVWVCDAPIAEDVASHDVPVPPRPVHWPLLHFLQLVFSPLFFVLLAGGPFFVGTEEAEVEAGGSLRRLQCWPLVSSTGSLGHCSLPTSVPLC